MHAITLEAAQGQICWDQSWDHNALFDLCCCRYARMRASDAKYHSPFSYSAIQAGYVYLGGKMDDITVVVSYVTLPSRV